MAEETTITEVTEAPGEVSEGPTPGQAELESADSTPSQEEIPQSNEEPAEEASSGEFEGQVQELETEVSRLRSSLEVREHELETLQQQMSSVTTRYRQALVASAPEVPEELIQGQTVEELDASLASARGIVEKIARQLESQAASERVPAGAPPRRPPDMSAMSPKDKILYALQRS
ncbi:MAG: hypothetical protein ACE5JL_10930 [Dehalococcoidia bacterium]